MNNETGDQGIPQENRLEGREEVSSQDHTGTASKDAGGATARQKVSGIYCIMNTVNGKRYIGSSARDVYERWENHRKSLELGKHHSIRLQRAWTKYGKEAFVFSILLLCDPAECIAHEQVFMDQFSSADPKMGYNININASSCLGIKKRPETIEKLRASLTGKPLSEEHKKKLRDRWLDPGFKAKNDAALAKGRANVNPENRLAASRKMWADPEIRARIIAAIKRPKSEEARRNMSRGQTGRKMSPESIAKRVDKLKGRKHPEELNERIRVLLTGRKRTPEQRARMSVARIGRKFSPMSEETKAKLRAKAIQRMNSPEYLAKWKAARHPRTTNSDQLTPSLF